MRTKFSQSWCAVALFATSFVGLGPVTADAAPVTWIGGNADWTDGTANDANWNPADEPDIDDEAIFNTANSVNLGSANTVEGLTMSGGIDLSAIGFGLTVDGLAQLTDAGTNLHIVGAGSALIADSVSISSGGAIRLNGLVNVSEESGDGLLDINADGLISGSGTVHLGDFVAAGTILLINDGTISALSPAPFPGAAPPVRTLAINASDTTDALIDLDGGAGNAILEVTRNQTLDINVRLTDQFSGDINLFHNSTLDFSTAWILDGTIDVNTGFVDNPPPQLDIPASIARISGAAFTQTGGTITVVDLDGTLQFNAPFTMNGGTLVNNGLVVFDADTLIASGANFTMPTGSSSITLSAAAVVNVDQANFDADGAGSATNVVTINSSAVLDLDLGAGADESLGGFLQLNGGELDVTTADADWAIQGNLSVGANTGESQINGHEVALTTAAVVVGANSTLQVNAANVWEAQSSLTIDAGATARLNGTTTFSGVSVTGNGTLRTAGITTFDGPTTITLPSGTVILDGDDAIGGNVTINADTTINAGTMADFGNVNVIGFNTLVLNDVAKLTVNPAVVDAQWTLTQEGRLDINASTATAEGSGIHGADFNMNGIATISGNSVWGARTNISGTVTIAAGGRLLLGGGHRLTTMNQLEGGAINGNGVLGAASSTGLQGFGTIDADIDFDGDSELFAAGGTLTLGGDILDARFLGTADASAILDVTNPWSTAVIQQLVLNGGELRGGTITNDELIRAASGETLVTARVINNLQIFADGGDIIFDTAGDDNDWDGAANDAQLNALNGDIMLRDNQDFDYGGTVFIGSGHEVYTIGFSIEMQPGSLLDLTGGTLRQSANRGGHVAGELVVHAGADSALKTDSGTGSFVLESTSEVTLNGNLRLDSRVSSIEAGATFTGTGRLMNVANRELAPDHLADIGVTVENQGVYDNSGSDVGRNDMLQFVQTASGTFRIDLEGTALAQHDRLQVDGQAQLDGSLELILDGGYVPSDGDMLDIISATGSVTGTFASVIQPDTMPIGLFLKPIYSLTLVQLMVVNQVPGDYNLNGVVDSADYVVWRNTLSLAVTPFSGADGDGDGTIDSGDYDVWRAHFGQAAGGGSEFGDSAAIPEPSTLVLAGLTLSTFLAILAARSPRMRQINGC